MIKLLDLLDAYHIDIDRLDHKIHLATSDPTSDADSSPLEAFFSGRFKDWQELQTRQNFTRKFLISLIALGNHRWLFAGVFRIIGCEKQASGEYRYQTELLQGQDLLLGKVVVSHRRTTRNSYLIGDVNGDAFEVVELRHEPLPINAFPGYEHICLPFSRLKEIISQQIPSWLAPLSSVKGIYLITDTHTGRHYVGSAYGDQGVWQRWSEYVATGHGSNKGMVALLLECGAEHCHHFQFSLLEVMPFRTENEDVVAREVHWKNVLQSRRFGLNEN